jgi:hypothetical protein
VPANGPGVGVKFLLDHDVSELLARTAWPRRDALA